MRKGQDGAGGGGGGGAGRGGFNIIIHNRKANFIFVYSN